MRFRVAADASFPPLADGGPNRVQASAVSAAGPRLAVATADRVVALLDAGGARRDRFSTKPAQVGVAYAAGGVVLSSGPRRSSTGAQPTCPPSLVPALPRHRAPARRTP
jgi:hypothetical protein